MLVFSADDGQHGEEAWVSNGSVTGTQMLQDVLPGPASSHPRSFTRVAGRVYFAANDGESGVELWTVPLSAIQAATGRRLHFPQLLSFRP
jgi:ELWxxDGT repeat protein